MKKKNLKPRSSTQKRDSDWWKEFFPVFRPVFGIVSRRATNAQVRFILKKLNLGPGKTFLDCPCGIGRIALPLAKAGVKVTGVDITRSYLDELKGKLEKTGWRMDLYRNDMRRINFDSEFDAAGNLWTSFGFFEKESDNLLVLKKMYKALKPGGKFLLHVINRDWIMANFQATDGYEAGKIKVINKRGFDYATSVSTDHYIFIGPDGESHHDTAIRMYSYHELIAMFKKVGFVNIEGYATVKEAPISREHSMMFVFGTRPKRH